MKYVILIHSNPQPWGHPTGDFLAEHQALPGEERARLEREFAGLLEQMDADGELVGGEGLGDPSTARRGLRHGRPADRQPGRAALSERAGDGDARRSARQTMNL